ncbi:MAG: UDP-N-acetylmuramoyl-tripeptide--D-alanyl-D-alanine ligase [Firmicutes bacterium]|nr:UDP-N-acetylmuramoyl-tripeptide--D-alanyl-D-alanine ligase [Bacillota bacterium]
MRYRKLKELASLAGMELLGKQDTEINGIAIDSREASEGQLFVAVKGPSNDGHKYLEGAYAGGCRAFLVSDMAQSRAFFEKHDDVSRIVCGNTEFGAMELAAAYLREVDPLVVGITGSTGKTSTRARVAAVLSEKYRIHTAKKNLNTYLGISMTIFSMDEDTEALVLEMGMDRKNEIYEYCKRIRPDAAVITNVGTVHMEYIGSQEGIAAEKLKITSFFGPENTLVYNCDSPFMDDESIDKLSSGAFKRFPVGEGGGALLKIENAKDLGLEGISFDMILEGESAHCEMPVMGLHNAHNGALAAAIGHLYGISLENAAKALSKASVENKRLTPIRLKGDILLVDDSYNANPDSVASAISTMAAIDAKRRICVLARMGELGPVHKESHLAIGKLIADRGMDIAVLVGPDRELYAEGIMRSEESCSVSSFPDMDSAADFVESLLAPGDAVLVKGSLATGIHELAARLRKELGY